MKIGLVLAAVPGYSETFFRNKIRLLQEAGVRVIIFADRKDLGVAFDSCQVRYGFQTLSNSFLQKIHSGYWIVVNALKNPVKSWNLWMLNTKSGYSIRKRIGSLISSGHMLSEQIDWLHFGFGTLALGRENVARVMGARMAVSFRGFDIAIYPLKYPRCYQLLWETVDKVHVISDDLAKFIVSGGYLKEKPLIKITPAIDVSRFHQPQRPGIFHTPCEFVTTARLHWKKGLEYTLEALSILAAHGIDFHYSIIGEGEERERLIYASHQLGLGNRVTFTGKLQSDDVIEKLKNADIYLQYSIQEGFCNAVLEAQAMGLLCIVSNAEGLSENVLHEETGWVVQKRDAVALARQIESVVSMDEGRLQKVRAVATHRVKELFNLERQKREFINFYEVDGFASEVPNSEPGLK